MRYHEKLKIKMDQYAHMVYGLTKSFPKEELYGVTSQLRRSSLSVILNYVEGFARRKGDNCKVYKNFLEISYGSLKESKYLLHFSLVEKYLSEDDYKKIAPLSDEIGAMLYKAL
ncbi:four helix bundle protein [Candidatus Parcubacteria bacterium]|nr:MAG: four helix bundle protein [Candidatus Parcubacteria bacterium]